MTVISSKIVSIRWLGAEPTVLDSGDDTGLLSARTVATGLPVASLESLDPRYKFTHLQHRDVRISCCSRSSLRDALPAETPNRGAGLAEDGNGREGGTGTG
jgi:hypothetical protein